MKYSDQWKDCKGNPAPDIPSAEAKVVALLREAARTFPDKEWLDPLVQEWFVPRMADLAENNEDVREFTGIGKVEH